MGQDNVISHFDVLCFGRAESTTQNVGRYRVCCLPYDESPRGHLDAKGDDPDRAVVPVQISISTYTGSSVMHSPRKSIFSHVAVCAKGLRRHW